MAIISDDVKSKFTIFGRVFIFAWFVWIASVSECFTKVQTGGWIVLMSVALVALFLPKILSFMISFFSGIQPSSIVKKGLINDLRKNC